MKRVLLLSLTYSPDNVSTAQIMAGLAEDLKRRGFGIKVLTTTPHYHRDAGMEAKQPLRWACWPILKKSTLNGIEVSHIVMLSKSCPKWLRLLSWLWFVGAAAVIGIFMRFRFDSLLVCTPPPFIGPCAALISKLRGAKLVYNVQELYPDIAVNLGAMRANGRIECFFKWMESITYRRAAFVTSITEAMCAKLRERMPPDKVRLIPNFVSVTPGAVAPAKTGDRFTVTYAGNMGVPQKLDLLVEAARLAPELKFLLVGDGRDRARLEKLASGLANVEFTGYLPLEAMPGIYAASDVFYVGQDAKAAADGIPSKIYRILANGRAIVAATPATADLAAFIDQSGGGVTVSDFNATTLAATLQALAAEPQKLVQMAKNGSKHVLENYSLEQVGRQYAEILA